jgi:hypothetical protein
LSQGQAAGINGTPALFVNGVNVPGGAVPYEVVAAAIDRELQSGLASYSSAASARSTTMEHFVTRAAIAPIAAQTGMRTAPTTPKVSGTSMSRRP